MVDSRKVGRSGLRVESDDVRATVAMCAGKDCRARCEYSKMRRALERHCDVVELACVGICKGPVVVAHPHSEAPLVFSKLRSKQQRKQVVRVALHGGTPSRELAARAVRGSKRKATIRRVRRALDRAS